MQSRNADAMVDDTKPYMREKKFGKHAQRREAFRKMRTGAKAFQGRAPSSGRTWQWRAKMALIRATYTPFWNQILLENLNKTKLHVNATYWKIKNTVM